MMDLKKPSAEYLRSVLRYEGETGLLFWKSRDAETFHRADGKGVRGCDVKKWNTRFSGNPAFSTWSSQGYKTGELNGVMFRSHRVIWCMETGEWPDQIDHIDGDRSNNRLGNLRSVSVAENNKNKRLGRNNKTGFVGVHWCKSSNAFVATVGSPQAKGYIIGRFAVLEDAVSARKREESKWDFHQNHGQARLHP